MHRLVPLILLLGCLSGLVALPRSVPAQPAESVLAAPISGESAGTRTWSARPDEAALGAERLPERHPERPMDPRVATTLTLVTGAAVLTVGIVAFPWLAEVLSIGSYSVLCTVAPVC